ncbi:MAG: NnrS family protein [Burkholderiales bacterium]|nr:NnrS family protein [Burkholderiales bacterium]
MSALFALGFRPFYLLAGLYAALSVPIWAAQYAGWLPGANPLWHAHEMLFGYAFAVISGFLFTAVRNWTGRPTPAGAPLAAIAALWIAARALAVLRPSAAPWADAAFAVAVAWGIGQPILSSGNRNWFFIPLVLALGAASIAFQAWPHVALSAGLDVVLFIIALMGGRVIPSFTNSAVPGAGARTYRGLEFAALGSVLVLLAFDLAEAPAAAFAALAAAVLHGARLALWAPLKTRGRPILWILHLSYAWIVVHLALRGLSGWDLVPPVLATHALTIGGIGGLTLGMMTRTARGHTGRTLQAGSAEVWAYLLVQASALARVLVPIAVPQAYAASVAVSAALWSAAFALFCVAFVPILSAPRLDGRPG